MQKAIEKKFLHLQMSRVKLEKICGLFDGRTSVRTLLAPSLMCREFKRLSHASLRALHWQGLFPTSFSFVNAKHLRYLDLSSCSVDAKLLHSICLLYNLQTLRLNDCYGLRQLPEDMMISLTKLIHLYLF